MLKTLYQWLTTDSPTSLLQARINAVYRFCRLLFRYNTTKIAIIIILGLIFIALFAPWLAPYSPSQQCLVERLQSISIYHLFGTDELGRDIFSRVIYGSRYALYVVGLVSILVVPIGLIIGVTAGYVGGLLDLIIIRIIDIFLAFPRLILALAFVAALGPGINNAILAIVFTAWAPYARLARAQTLFIAKSEFITAIKLQGASSVRILFIHILPLCVNATMVQASLDMSGFILSVAGLGFLGLGAQPPTPEWGAMIATGREYLLEQWWLVTFPGLAIALVSIGFNLLGDGLRDIFDPRHAIHY